MFNKFFHQLFATLPSATGSKPSTKNMGVVFDIDALVGKNIDQIRQLIGNPQDEYFDESTETSMETGSNLANSYSSADYSHDYFMLIRFNRKTRKVSSFDLLNYNTFKKSSLQSYMCAGNLASNDPRYALKPVYSFINKNHLIFVSVIPQV